MRKLVLILVILSACAPVAKPSTQQATYQGNPNIVTNPLCTHNCGGATVTTTTTAQTSSEQPVAQPTSDRSLLWAILGLGGLVIVVVAIYLWIKSKRK